MNCEHHVEYIDRLISNSNANSLECVMAIPLKISAVFWGLGSYALLGKKLDDQKSVAFLQSDESEFGCLSTISEWVFSCQLSNGGICPSPRQEPNLQSTFYGLQTLVLLEVFPRAKDIRRELEELCEGEVSWEILKDLEVSGGYKYETYLRILPYVASLYEQDAFGGAFKNDEYGEMGLTNIMMAIVCMSYIGCMDLIPSDAVVKWINSCHNIDGGFGEVTGMESHAAFTYTAICCLHLLGAGLPDCERWLSWRQVHSSGGLNGRPEKSPDLCYSWWIPASLRILGKLDILDTPKLLRFIQRCQADGGGIADRPGDAPDIFHTYFGLAGAALLNGNIDMDPVRALPKYLVENVI